MIDHFAHPPLNVFLPSQIDTAVALEKAALADDYFIQRKLYPNVDFYSGLIYKAMGFPTDMFPVLFMIPRAVGWLAHWVESLVCVYVLLLWSLDHWLHVCISARACAIIFGACFM